MLVLLLLLEGSIVLGLQVCYLLGLFARLLDFLKRSDLLLLKHPNPVPQLLYILLDSESNGPGLVVSQVLAFDVNHDVFVVVRG